MKKPYHILDSAKQQPVSPNELARLLSQNAQLMLPLVELVEQCRGAVDEVIDVTGRAVIQAVLELSAQQVTGGELSQPARSAAPMSSAGAASGAASNSATASCGFRNRGCANAPAARSQCPPAQRCRTTNDWARTCSTF